MRFISTLVFAIVATVCLAVDGQAGPYHVSLSTEPDVVPVGKARVTVRVTGKDGHAVSDATVTVFAKMPGMNMGEREESAAASGKDGTYIAPATFAMAGQYDVTLTVSGAEGTGKAVLNLNTGQSSSGKSAGGQAWWLIGGLVLVVGFVVWRMRATHQKVMLKGVLNRTVVLSLLLLAGAIGVGVWAVRNLRREGAMTPLEAQVMEMNTPAPEGALPVVLAEAKVESFAETINYSGQVVGFVEQDVVPRVAGLIVAMPVYVGDHVKRGQVLARLDTSQTDPMVAEKAAAVSNASQGVNVAASEYSQSQNMVEQARAEAQMATEEIREAKAMLESATASQAATASAAEAATAEQRAAQSELDAANADQTYQRQELERSRQLFGKGALSKDEWQLAVATAQKADAAAASAKSRLARAVAMATSARNEVKRAAADVTAATTKVTKAEANLKAKQAQVKTAQSGVKSAEARLGQSRAAVSEAGALLKGATTQRDYAELRAETDGVVTQRVVSPGVVVSPGQSLLKVAQVAPVRLQVNVPQQDLAKVRVGDEFQVRVAGSSSDPLVAKVTSVSPAVDPASRMGTVEALYDNSDKRFSPGQFIAAEIVVGVQEQSLVIPSDALVTETRGGKTLTKVWVATAGQGRLTVMEREVEVAGRSHDKVSVRAGLNEGERVVVSPFGLTDGMTVRSIEPLAKASGGALTIELNSEGYSPASFEIPAGKPVKLVFIRRVAETCGTSVKFPDLKIEVETPLNKPVTVDIPPQPAGKTLYFACPMDMYKGQAVVK